VSCDGGCNFTDCSDWSEGIVDGCLAADFFHPAPQKGCLLRYSLCQLAQGGIFFQDKLPTSVTLLLLALSLSCLCWLLPFGRPLPFGGCSPLLLLHTWRQSLVREGEEGGVESICLSLSVGNRERGGVCVLGFKSGCLIAEEEGSESICVAPAVHLRMCH
jgi:hypothetical protein